MSVHVLGDVEPRVLPPERGDGRIRAGSHSTTRGLPQWAAGVPLDREPLPLLARCARCGALGDPTIGCCP